MFFNKLLWSRSPSLLFYIKLKIILKVEKKKEKKKTLEVRGHSCLNGWK